MRLVLFLSLVIISSCKTSKPVAAVNPENLTVISNYDELKPHVGKVVILEGKMTMEKFVNKAGKEGDFYEFWLEMKNTEGKINQVMLRNKGEAISKEPITRQVQITGTLFYGSVDTDNPMAQSRVGYRLDYNAIKIIGQ